MWHTHLASFQSPSVGLRISTQSSPPELFYARAQVQTQTNNIGFPHLHVHHSGVNTCTGYIISYGFIGRPTHGNTSSRNCHKITDTSKNKHTTCCNPPWTHPPISTFPQRPNHWHLSSGHESATQRGICASVGTISERQQAQHTNPHVRDPQQLLHAKCHPVDVITINFGQLEPVSQWVAIGGCSVPFAMNTWIFTCKIQKQQPFNLCVPCMNTVYILHACTQLLTLVG